MATTRSFESIISADSHFYEPPHLCCNALGNKYQSPADIGLRGVYDGVRAQPASSL